jgi:hypothetical protein
MPQTPARARVLIATGCSHCSAVVEGMTRLVKSGRLASLEVVNLSVVPEEGSDGGIRSVPVTQIGPFDLEGSLSPGELSDWVDAVANGEGWPAYYAHLLERQRLDEVVERVSSQRSCLVELLSLLANEDTGMPTRIGIGAVMEELAGTDQLRSVVPDLAQLTLSESHQTRADACHYLGLSGDKGALPEVRRLLDDEDADVREIAAETIAMLGGETD